MDFYQSYGALSYLRNYSDPTHNIRLSKEDSLLRLYNINLVQNTFSGKKKNYICKKSSSGSKYNNKRGHHRNNKMAPISEKRSPAIKENTKENISIPTSGKNTTQNGRGIGPEILDFRESWLQDMEMYKEHVKSPQTLLTTHNHLHTVDGCLTSPTNKSSENSKRRARTKSDSDGDARHRNFHDQDDGLVFKRAREDNTDFIIDATVNVNVLVDEIKKEYMPSPNPHHSPNTKSILTVPISNQITNLPTSHNNSKQQNQTNDTSHSNFINQHQQHKSINDNGTSLLPKNIIVNPYHLSLINTQETDKNKIVINSVKNNNVILQNTQISGGHCESHEKSITNNSSNTLTGNSVNKSKSPQKNYKNNKINNSSNGSSSSTSNNKQNNISNNVASTNPSNGGGVISSNSIAPTYAVALNDISNVTGNVSANINTTTNNQSANSIIIQEFLFDQDKINISSKVLPPVNTETRVNVPDNNDDTDSYYDDDEFLGVIDTAEDQMDSSDESDEEYSGCTYYLNSDEENLDRILENQSPIKIFQRKKQIAASITALLNDVKEQPESKEDDDLANSNLDTHLLLPEPSPHIATPSEYITPKSILTSSLFPLVPPYLTFSSHIEKGPPVPPELQRVLKWRLSAVMPKVVRRVVANSGFRLIKKTNDWMASWEKHMKSPCFRAIKSHQKFNHLPGTFKIGRKDSVWRNIKQYISKFGKKEFGFMQKSFVLPQDLESLKKAWPKHAKKGTKWIIKPPASARGAGIKVVSRWTEFPKQKPLIVQKYIERPLLINGNKFDLRLYVIITSINPLRIFMHTDGLARFASVQYRDDLHSLKDRCMHLTNYSINKFSSHYAKNEDHNACQGHKWTLKSLWNYFRQRGINTTKLWGALRNLVIKTVIGGEGCLNRMYKANVNSRYNCYELFGFDVLLDENLIPWLLEVNISPSLHSDLPLDQHVKGPLMQAVLNTVLYQIPPKLSQQHENLVKSKYNVSGPLCYDKRIFTTCLSQEEVRKHNHFTSRNIEFREEYLDTILDELTPDDVRCLIITEDELARSKPLERIFPSKKSYDFLKFLEGPRYYNRLLDAWETKFPGNKKKQGLKLLAGLCEKGYHLQVPDAALAKEPMNDIDIFELNALYKMQMRNSANKSNSPSPVLSTAKKDITLVTDTSNVVSQEPVSKTSKEDVPGSVHTEIKV